MTTREDRRLGSRLAAARQVVKRYHTRRTGLAVAQAYSTALDRAIKPIFDSAARRSGNNRIAESCAILAIGGYGRCEQTYHSDIDLAFVFGHQPGDPEADFIRSCLLPIYDAKFEVGHSARTVEEMLEIVGNDFHSTTGTIGCRLLWGSQALFDRACAGFYERLRRDGARWLLESLREDREARHGGPVDTLYLLEPDLKKSRGALRDLQGIAWLAPILTPDTDLRGLVRANLIDATEERRLRRALSFLIELRNALHLSEERPADRLTVELQIRTARPLGFRGDETMLPEEELMRAYYDHVQLVDAIGRRCDRAAAARLIPAPKSRVRLEPKRIGGCFLDDGTTLVVDRKVVGGRRVDPAWMIGYFDVAIREGLEFDPDSLHHLSEQTGLINESARASASCRERFLSLLRAPQGTYRALSAMHRSGVLGAYLPEFRLVQNLPRIDHYHMYTVDEHLLRSVKAGEELRERHALPASLHIAGQVAQTILRWDLLNLALLLHDVGKGEGRRHVILGAQIAQRVCERIGLGIREQEIVRSLVANHQRMSHMVLRRDVDDPGVAQELAEALEEPELLRMLFLHTVCDMRAVSQESWNDWRGSLLDWLFQSTLSTLRGKRPDVRPSVPPDRVADQVLKAVEPAIRRRLDTDDLEQFVADMPDRYRRSTPPAQVARHFDLARDLSDKSLVRANLTERERAGYLQITFVARDAPGVFSNLCGALTSLHFNILSAQIYTGRSGVCVDVFQVQSLANGREISDDVLERLERKLNRVFLGEATASWATSIRRNPPPLTAERLDLRPPTVDFKNDLSPHHTVIEIKAPDRPGLLFHITQVLEHHGVNIDLALISTESYRIVDVFYVTDLESNKLATKGEKLESLRAEIEAVIRPPDPPAATPATSSAPPAPSAGTR